MIGIRWAQGVSEYSSFDMKHLLEAIQLMMRPQAVFGFLWVHFCAVENEALDMKLLIPLEILSWDSPLIPLSVAVKQFTADIGYIVTELVTHANE